jgi:hypothetical protein
VDAIGERSVAGQPVADEGDPALAAEIARRVRPLLSPVGVAAVPLERRENSSAPARVRAEIVQRPGHSGHPEIDSVGPVVDLVRRMERPALNVESRLGVGDDRDVRLLGPLLAPLRGGPLLVLARPKELTQRRPGASCPDYRCRSLGTRSE